MVHLINFRIYDLPNGKRSLFAVRLEDDEYVLYDSEFGSRLPPRYRVEPDGRLINWFGDAPIFSANDLIDTGENYQE